MSRIFHTILASIVGLFVVLIVRTLTFGPSGVYAPECRPEDGDFIRADAGALERFIRGIQHKTVSWTGGIQDYDELRKLQDFIRDSYPVTHSSNLVELEIVANYSMLYTVRGSDSSLTPYLLAAHLDVVPAKGEDWEESPWEGTIRDGFIYGRGTIDFKHGIFGIMEALEFMLKRGDKPVRPFYVAFGHDEEIMGAQGAGNIAKLLESRNVKLEFILDEGLTVLDGFIPGMKTPAAGIGTSEKGYLTLKLTVNVTGGHSSMPNKESSIGILARAIQRLEENPHPNQFGNGPEIALFEYVAPRLTLPYKVVMTNLWLFKPLVAWFLSRKPSTNAMIRTTTAVTMFNAGVKENVIAQTATAVVNHRIHPAETIQKVIAYDKAVISDDRVAFEILKGFEPQALSPFGEGVFGFEAVRTSIYQIWKHLDVTVAPDTGRPTRNLWWGLNTVLKYIINQGGSGITKVLDFDKAVIGDERVNMEVLSAHKPLPLSPFGDDVFGFETIRTSIHQVWKHHDVTVCPGLMVGGTDTKHYTRLSTNIYRFSPTYMYPGDVQRFHGINERISLENYQDAVNFYYHVMKNSDKAKIPVKHQHSSEL